jgi:hypothetical protein
MSAQQQVNHQQQQQNYQQQMYSKSMDASQQQYAMNDALAGMSSSGFPAALGPQPGAGQHSMQGGQQYPAAELLASLGYSGDPAAAAAAMMGAAASQAGGSGMQPGFMQQLQEYYMSGDPAAAAAAVAGFMQDGLGNEYGGQVDFAQQQSGGGDARGSHAGEGQGYSQVRMCTVGACARGEVTLAQAGVL